MQLLSGQISLCRLNVVYSIMRSRLSLRERKGETFSNHWHAPETELLDRLIGVGFCTKKVPLNRLPGWEPESWGYHGDDGNSFCCQGTGKQYGPQFSTNDVIGCGVNFRTGTAFFTKNGLFLKTAFRDIKSTKLYPAVGMKRPGEHIRVNFGQEGFVFDIDGYMNVGFQGHILIISYQEVRYFIDWILTFINNQDEKAEVYNEINSHPTVGLCPVMDEAALIQALVAQYLAHDGYVDTARAFSADVQSEARALVSGREENTKTLELKEDGDAINRQSTCMKIESVLSTSVALTDHVTI